MKDICAIPRRMGRKMEWPEVTLAKFATGVFAQIAAVLDKGETRTEFIREAVARELRRRAKAKQRPSG